MLKKPSVILHEANVQLPREYAYKVDRSLHQIDQHTRLFDASFVNVADAVALEASVRRHFNNTIQCSGMESCIVLPPLFIRSQENAVVRVSPQLVLVMLSDGPVVPVLCLSSNSTSNPSSTTKLYSNTLPNNDNNPQDTLTQNAPTPSTCVALHIADNISETLEVKQNEVVEQQQQQPHQSPQKDETHQQPSPQETSCVKKNEQTQHTLSPEEERRFVEMMTKTPIAAVCSLQTTAARELLSREDQLQKYLQMKQSIEALYSQRMQHEQVLANPHISSTTERVLKESLARKCGYIQQHLSKIAMERAKLIDEQQTNEVTRRVLLASTDSDPKWHMDIEAESKHLQTCIDILESANPNMSV